MGYEGSFAFVRQVVVERSVHLIAVGENTYNVRSNDAHAVIMGDLDNFLFEGVVANFAETGGDDAETLDAFFAGIARHFCNKPGRHGDDSHIYHIRNILDVGVAFVTADFFGVGIDWVDRVLISAIFQVFDNFITDFVGVGRRTDNRDALWFENSINNWIHFFPPVEFCLIYQ